MIVRIFETPICGLTLARCKSRQILAMHAELLFREFFVVLVDFILLSLFSKLLQSFGFSFHIYLQTDSRHFLRFALTILEVCDCPGFKRCSDAFSSGLRNLIAITLAPFYQEVCSSLMRGVFNIIV